MFNFSDDLNLQYLLLNLQLSGSYWFLMKVNAFHPGGALFETLWTTFDDFVYVVMVQSCI